MRQDLGGSGGAGGADGPIIPHTRKESTQPSVTPEMLETVDTSEAQYLADS